MHILRAPADGHDLAGARIIITIHTDLCKNVNTHHRSFMNTCVGIFYQLTYRGCPMSVLLWVLFVSIWFFWKDWIFWRLWRHFVFSPDWCNWVLNYTLNTKLNGRWRFTSLFWSRKAVHGWCEFWHRVLYRFIQSVQLWVGGCFEMLARSSRYIYMYMYVP